MTLKFSTPIYWYFTRQYCATGIYFFVLELYRPRRQIKEVYLDLYGIHVQSTVQKLQTLSVISIRRFC